VTRECRPEKASRSHLEGNVPRLACSCRVAKTRASRELLAGRPLRTGAGRQRTLERLLSIAVPSPPSDGGSWQGYRLGLMVLSIMIGF